MFSGALRAAAALAVVATMVCEFAATNAQVPPAASPSPGAAGSRALAVEDLVSLGTVVVYSQPPGSSGGLIPSSLRDPDGSATDQWAWDDFRFGWAQAITEVQWRGGYKPYGSGGPVFDFTVDIYPSIAAGTEPDIAHPPLVHYHVGGNAGEAAADILGGVQTYDYLFVLPAPFQATAGAKYWVQIEAFQSGAPDWGLSASMSGDGHYFRKHASEFQYQLVPGDAAFTLLAPSLGGYRIYLPSVLHAGSG